MLAFVIAMILLTISPGPDVLYVMSLSMGKGARPGIAAGWGLATGTLLHTALMALGISPLICGNAKLFLVVKIVGACYLTWLAWKSWQHRHDKIFKGAGSREQGAGEVCGGNANSAGTAGTQNQPAPRSLLPTPYFFTGMGMSMCNPKLILIFLAIFPQFLPPAETFWEMSRNVMIYGVLFALQAGTVFSLVSLFAGTLFERLRERFRIEFWLNCLTTAILLLIALSVIFVKNSFVVAA